MKIDNLTSKETTFFKVFICNDYLSEIYKTNGEYHFQQILKVNGYTTKDINETKKLKKSVAKKMIEEKEDYIKQKFTEYIKDIESYEIIEP